MSGIELAGGTAPPAHGPLCRRLVGWLLATLVAASSCCLADPSREASGTGAADMATRNPWAASVFVALQRAGSLGHIESGTWSLDRFPTLESVRALLAGDEARARSLASPATHAARVTWRVERGADAKARLHLSSFVVDDDGRMLFKVYPDIEVDLFDRARAWREPPTRAGQEGATGPGNFAMATTRHADEEKALALARSYSKAWMARDADTIAALSHPVLVIRAGGIAKYREEVAHFFDQIKGIDLEHGSEAIGTPSYELVLGKSRMIGIPSVRKASGAAVTPSVYVAVSYDEGRTWSVLSASCTDERWLEALVPGYRGTPDILGKVDSRLTESVDDESFDEAAFLRGPRYVTLPSR
jgi:hypothetical protein